MIVVGVVHEISLTIGGIYSWKTSGTSARGEG
jgi:hypothetical protein